MQALEILQKIRRSFSYPEYKYLVVQCAEKGGTTGNDQSQERIEATRLNAVRMNRLDHQVKINERIASLARQINTPWVWIVLAESWCGDGAQNIPVIAKIAALSNNIELDIVLRDENPELMDAFLTNGTRSIPRLICIDLNEKKILGTWGPRPQKIKQMAEEYKAAHVPFLHSGFVKNLHTWYARDKGVSMQEDMEQLLADWVTALSQKKREEAHGKKTIGS